MTKRFYLEPRKTNNMHQVAYRIRDHLSPKTVHGRYLLHEKDRAMEKVRRMNGATNDGDRRLMKRKFG